MIMRISMRSLASIAGFFVCAVTFSNAWATSFTAPEPDQSLIGQVEMISAHNGDTTTTIAERYDLGFNAIVAANSGGTDVFAFSGGSNVKIPTQFLLPPLPRKGIIINLPEMRMYFFPEGSNQVMTFPIGIGRIGKTIPIKNTKITRKAVNPVWIPPQDIREFVSTTQGIKLPKVMGAGPDNPLGPYAIYLGIPTYLIHSTIFPESIGRRASFGCIRMNEADIKQFFPVVSHGTPVTIIDMPNKIAWSGNALYMEAHEPLSERIDVTTAQVQGVVNMIDQMLPRGQVTLVNWQMVADLVDTPDGLPHDIGVRLK